MNKMVRSYLWVKGRARDRKSHCAAAQYNGRFELVLMIICLAMADDKVDRRLWVARGGTQWRDTVVKTAADPTFRHRSAAR